MFIDVPVRATGVELERLVEALSELETARIGTIAAATGSSACGILLVV